MPEPPPDRSLGVIAIGAVAIDAFATLEPLFGSVELLEIDVPPCDPLLLHRALIHQAVDASSARWFLILRERESVDAALASELARAAVDAPRAWGYRLRTQPLYAGEPLLIGDDGGEIRLFHRRHGRFDKDGKEPEMRVQGTVVRLEQPLRAVTFASAGEHRAWLAAHCIPHSLVRRLLIFAHGAIVTGAWFRSRATLQYLWIEAGYDRG
jgi:hypothetical protein